MPTSAPGAELLGGATVGVDEPLVPPDLAVPEERPGGGASGSRRLARAVGLPWRARGSEVAQVVTAVVTIQVVVFHAAWRGTAAPPWDFFSHYLADAHAWWRDGGFFGRHDWVPYLWGGYPGTVDLQNSSWYLPVGLLSAVTTYDVHAAAILSALHVALGGVGTYVLARRFRLRPAAAMLALVAWSFAAGFYSNASHVDIARGYAWIPWVLACASPSWPWRRWWGVALATLVLWQAALGIYPGMVVAAVYCVGLWVLLQQFALRPRMRDFLVPLVVSAAVAGALTAPRYLTALAAGAGRIPSGSAADVWDWRLAGTFLYPYGSASLPNDVTMRSFFLPATVFALLACVSWRSQLARAGGAMALLAWLLSVPGPVLRPLTRQLPGLSLSRFGMSDFKVFVLAGLLVVAAAGLDRMLAASTQRSGLAPVLAQPDLTIGRRSLRRWPLPGWRRGGPSVVVDPLAALALTSLGVVVAFLGPYRWTQWSPQLIALVCAFFVVRVIGRARTARRRRWATGALVALTACSGALGAFGTTGPWSGSTPADETALYGASVRDLAAGRAPVGPFQQRPARRDGLDTPEGYGARWPTLDNLSALYGRGYGLSGYVNLKGTPAFEAIRNSLSDPGTFAMAREFWTAAGLATSTVDGQLPSEAETRACAASGRCGSVVTEPVAFEHGSDFVYDIASRENAEVSFNEAYYTGWSASACTTAGDDCQPLTVHGGRGGQAAVDLPAGTWRVSLRYRIPYWTLAWCVFAAGAAALVGWSASCWWVGRVRRDQRDGPYSPFRPRAPVTCR